MRACLPLALSIGATLTLGLTVPVRAEEVRYPEAKPLVALDVPGDWKVATTDLGLELAAPDRKAFVVAGLVARSRQAAEAWTKQAAERMRDFGLTIDPSAKAPTLEEAPAPKETSVPKEAPAHGAASLPEPSPSGETLTFSGALSPEALPKPTTPMAPEAGPTLDQIISAAPPPGALMPKIPFHAVQYVGASLKGHPVDLQLIVYSVSPTQDFLVEQASDANDPRAATIVTSAKLLR